MIGFPNFQSGVSNLRDKEQTYVNNKIRELRLNDADPSSRDRVITIVHNTRYTLVDKWIFTSQELVDVGL